MYRAPGAGGCPTAYRIHYRRPDEEVNTRRRRTIMKIMMKMNKERMIFHVEAGSGVATFTPYGTPESRKYYLIRHSPLDM